MANGLPAHRPAHFAQSGNRGVNASSILDYIYSIEFRWESQTAFQQRPKIMLIDVIQKHIYDNETSTYHMPQKFFVRYNKLDEGSTDWYDINLLRHKSPRDQRAVRALATP